MKEKHIQFARVRALLGTRKAPGPPRTTVWLVRTASTTDMSALPTVGLGLVQWFSRWRQYTFVPHGGTVFEKDCLRTIADFCEEQTTKHRRRDKEHPFRSQSNRRRR
jgi:hypothetical protein